MAFPTVNSTNTSQINSNTGSHTVSLPGTVNAGELLLVFFATDGDNTTTFPPVVWNKIFSVDNSTDAHLSIAYKIADGTEGGTTISVTTTSSERSSHASYAIQSHGSSTNTPEQSTGNTGASNSADPDSVTASWGSDDNLFIAVAGGDGNSSGVSAYPYADNNITIGNSNNNGCWIGVCSDEIASDTANPGTFTNRDDQWVAATVVVSPVAPVTNYSDKIIVASILTP